MNAYIINSNKSLTQIRSAVESNGGCAALKIVYNRTKDGFKETNNTLLICKPSTVDKLNSLEDFKNCIRNYKWSNFYAPNDVKNETWDLHITGLPQNLTSAEAISFVNEKIEKIVPSSTEYDVPYKIDFDFSSRETGKIHGFGRITFHDKVGMDEIKLCKLALHNCAYTVSGNDSRRYLSCTWHISKTPAMKTQTSAEPKKKKTYVRSILKRDMETTSSVTSNSSENTITTPTTVQTVSMSKETVMAVSNTTLPNLATLTSHIPSVGSVNTK
jgi:hypothetical protein